MLRELVTIITIVYCSVVASSLCYTICLICDRLSGGQF